MDIIENLGRLAARMELAAADPKFKDYERTRFEELANRYREAQFVELRKHIARV